jgi:AAA+ ATPase superfamily predicted ATPase
MTLGKGGVAVFIGREAEMAKLEALYKEPGFQMPVIYGRRRVGKTRLLQEFCAGKKCVFYTAIEQNDGEALRLFSRALLEALPGEASSYIDSFDSWDSAFRYAADFARTERLILAIDEYPYLAGANSALPSILQRAIDHYFSAGSLFLVLCGSSMSFMENEVLNYKSPLYGRRTAQLKIQPLDCFDSIKFLPGWEEAERLMAYGITGGIPQYLLAAARHDSFREAVVEEFLTGSGVLYEEPANLMKQEMREPAVYNSVIRAVAGGASRQSEISDRVGMPSGSAANYIRALADLDIIEKERPFGDKSPRRVVYRVKDHLFRFWHRFIPAALPMIGMGMPSEAYDMLIAPNYSEYFGPVFEEICRQYLVRRNRKRSLGDIYTNFSRWWGTNPATKQQEEIDIVGAGENGALFGECKWRGERASSAELDRLVRRSANLLTDKDREFFLFSRSGFTKGLVQKAAGAGNLTLVGLRELLDV